MRLKILWLLVTISASCIQDSNTQEWTDCLPCMCIWRNGQPTANCEGKLNTTRIPRFSTEIKVVHLTNNPLRMLGPYAVLDANLQTVHKLYLQNCSIETVDEHAFKNISVAIEIDLSKNSITRLHSNTFNDGFKLRSLKLSQNKIKVIEDGLLSSLTELKNLFLDHNEIEYISENVFSNLGNLTILDLGNNKLKTIRFDFKMIVPKLNSLNVENNSWICDCHLELFHQSMIVNNLITSDLTTCHEPPKLRGRLWTIRDPFPCAPVIIQPSGIPRIKSALNSDVTIECQVTGEPEPDVIWSVSGQIIDPRKNKKYFLSKRKIGEYTWNNLTLLSVSTKDKGEYKCTAKNSGGEDSRSISLVVDNEVAVVGGFFGSTLIIALSVGLIILLIIILILVCLFCKRANNRTLSSKRSEFGNSSEECINMSVNLDIKKGLITDVNPINKPPRTTVPASIVSGGTEVSDVKRNLLDSDSVFDCDEESRSLDFDQPLIRKSSNALLDMDYRVNNHPYPPDLLAFPPRNQISPAGSNASTVIIGDTRLPPMHGPQSPMQSPIYDQLSIYRTLPYSRSQSPFSQGAGVPRIPRQGAGYVTIPRRPRQSWSASSEPPTGPGEIAEPVYDNLGVRSTADGSSAISLNKLGSEPATPRTNRLASLLPPTIVPIIESHESPNNSNNQPEETQSTSIPSSQSLTLPRPSPSHIQAQPERLETKPTPNPKPRNTREVPIQSQTLPRKLNSTKLTPSKTQWAMANMEQLRNASEKRNSISGDDTLTKEGKQKKIPPRPPPKPKKRMSGPLFEDEGEDGTEV
ncbi:uncharacterized protein LOC126737383 [Anthonomus grandis grandis]|uniref:uncharacterized protein LOC126737383 n=1 Tax=Anthonomus grandis grandis TaxID=2921223 RepID=UPI002165E343|nr:uncharacterized protein LOC126737383 [Anthonomus grandis grandis]